MNQNRRNILKKIGTTGIAVGGFGGISGVASARHSKNRTQESMLYDETKLTGHERGDYISDVRSSEQFNAIKHALIKDHFTPHMGRPAPTTGKFITSDNTGKQLIVPFKSHGNTDRTATAYAVQEIGSSSLNIIAIVRKLQQVLIKYFSNTHIVNQTSTRVTEINLTNQGGN